MADYSRLPGPNADVWDWQLRGLCRGKDSSLFFHPEGERGAARAAREQSAKEICLNCPVQKQCSEHALRVREPYGVWGGMTEEERENHYQRYKALVRARAAREKTALAEKAVLKEKLLRDHERELARRAELEVREAGLREAEARAAAEARTAEARAAAPAPTPAAASAPSTDRVAPKKKTPVVAKPVRPAKRAAAAKPPAKQSPAKVPANSKKRTPAKV
jgi:WhiB family transcriptional regulator, redox-sensing transcriptional regulator